MKHLMAHQLASKCSQNETFLRPILTVASVWNTGETGDIHSIYL